MKVLFCFRLMALMLCTATYLTFAGGCTRPAGKGTAVFDAAQLKPGLSVLYLDGGYRFVKQIPKGDKAREKGWSGKPVLQINHQFGNGEVFDSGKSSKVGVLLDGYIHLAKPGAYALQVLSNDGVEVYVDGKLIVSDPNVHSDRLSDIGVYTSAKEGWQPLHIRYFQRKGSAALKLYWRPPGSSEFEVVPEGAYGHFESQ
jgi:hypothetical protein